MSRPTTSELARRIVAAIDATVAGEAKDSDMLGNVDDVRRMLNMCVGMLAAASCERVQRGLAVQALRTALLAVAGTTPLKVTMRLDAELERIMAMPDPELWPVHRTALLATIDRYEAEA